jgi:RNA polymerase sigma factor (sigma-70 family)
MAGSLSSSSVAGSLSTLFTVGTFGGMTDGQLLDRFVSRKGEEAEAAFATLVASHGPMVWDVCRSFLSDSHAAEDAFQATFLVLVRKAGTIRRRDAVGPWLHGVARRVAARAKAALARQRVREGQEQDMTTTSDPDPTRREFLEVLREEIERLSEKHRAALVLCDLEGRTHAEAAQLLRCPVGTVSVRVSRGRNLLRARLTRRGVVLPVTIVGATVGSLKTASAMPVGLADSTIRVAMSVAAGKVMTAGAVPASVAELVGGGLRTMIITKWKWVAAGLVATWGATVGVVGLSGERQADPRAIAPAGVAAAPAPVQANEGEEKARLESMNNLKIIGLAMHNFADQHNSKLPAAAIRRGGKPLLSWRVAILPYLEQQALYLKFHLDEPWDSPHNKALLSQMPEVYAPVAHKGNSEHSTYYQVFAGPGTVFGADEGMKLIDIKDGTSATLMVVEAAKPVPWTKPEDVPFDAAKPVPELGGLLTDGFCAGFADSSARFFKRQIDAKLLKALITANGGETVRLEEL